MSNGKYSKRRGVSTKAMSLVLALVLVIGASVGATLAWLTDETETVTNTFSPTGIDITLTETMNTDTNSDGTNDAWTAALIPGKEYAKDPVVAVDGSKTNVDVYLFVVFEENNDPDTYLTYDSNLRTDDGWTLVTGKTNVWWREVKASDTTKSWNLLEGDKVTVKADITKEQLANITTNPSLEYTAYAIQTEGFTNADAAWTEAAKMAE